MNSNYFKLDNVRVMFPSIVEKAKFKNREGEKYELTVLIPKDTEQGAKFKKFADDFKSSLDHTFKDSPLPVRDGDAAGNGVKTPNTNYKGHYYITLKSKLRPVMVDASGAVENDPDKSIELARDVYPGCYINVRTFLYSVATEMGGHFICGAFDLVQFAKDAPPMALRTATQRDAEAFGFTAVDLSQIGE